ncbi:hypothetical protein BHM03_00041165 [Ensete ventricosum]|nr:hypothetical protein BHM03_00041165 [Ensete ventricosum]
MPHPHGLSPLPTADLPVVFPISPTQVTATSDASRYRCLSRYHNRFYPLPRPTRVTLLLWLLAASCAIASDQSYHSRVTTSQQSQKRRRPLLLFYFRYHSPSAAPHFASSVIANHCNLLLDRTLLYHRGTLAPSSSPVAIVAPKRQRDCCPSCHCHWPPLFLPFTPHDVVASSLTAATLAAEAVSNLILVAAPPYCHRCTSLLPLLPPLSPISFSIYW